MASQLALRCRCGHVVGLARQVSPAGGFRFLCYCQDCQAFARFLGRPDMLDAAGGTDIFQLPPARVTLAGGGDALRCLRLSTTGVLRWYAECCRTPVANTAADPRFPLVGLIHCFVDNAGGASRDAVLGPPRCRLYGRSAIAPLPETAPRPLSVGLSLARTARILSWWMRGLARPTPFFADRTNAPLALPRVLTPGERAAL